MIGVTLTPGSLDAESSDTGGVHDGLPGVGVSARADGWLEGEDVRIALERSRTCRTPAVPESERCLRVALRESEEWGKGKRDDAESSQSPLLQNLRTSSNKFHYKFFIFCLPLVGPSTTTVGMLCTKMLIIRLMISFKRKDCFPLLLGWSPGWI